MNVIAKQVVLSGLYVTVQYRIPHLKSRSPTPEGPILCTIYERYLSACVPQ